MAHRETFIMATHRNPISRSQLATFSTTTLSTFHLGSYRLRHACSSYRSPRGRKDKYQIILPKGLGKWFVQNVTTISAPEAVQGNNGQPPACPKPGRTADEPERAAKSRAHWPSKGRSSAFRPPSWPWKDPKKPGMRHPTFSRPD